VPRGFERGRIYNRRADIHDRFGGQRQNGIITPSAHNLVIVITGEVGLTHGYKDQLLDDGTYEYFGEGQVGDMQFVRGNRAIRDHSANGCDLLLFTETRDGLRFDGEMVCGGYRFLLAPDTKGNQRRAIVFQLRPLEAVVAATNDDLRPIPTAEIGTLRSEAIAAANSAPQSGQRVVNVVERCRAVRDYVVARANGHCEGCRMPAPFVRTNGVPYLEPHHIRRLSDGGPDDPHFVIALCPNCHRRVHHANDGAAYNDTLLGRMARIEPPQ